MKVAGIEPTEEDLVEAELSQSVIESERQYIRNKSCYKVLTCDANDDIVPLQGSLMLGVARQAALRH